MINDQPDMLAERVFTPWTDMEDVMRREGLPLYGLESKHPLRDFDLLGISLPYEQLYTNVLNLLDLAGMPVRAADRDETSRGDRGRPCRLQPRADGRLHRRVCDRRGRGDHRRDLPGAPAPARPPRAKPTARPGAHRRRVRAALLRRDLSRRWDGRGGNSPTRPMCRSVVPKRIVPVLPPPFTRLLVPYVDTVHNRAPIEIMRGCTRGCRFCHAGMVTRPVRERSVEEVRGGGGGDSCATPASRKSGC